MGLIGANTFALALATFYEAEWEEGRFQTRGSDERLGQYLVNVLLPSGKTDPEIFYCVDDNRAVKLFTKKYVGSD